MLLGRADGGVQRICCGEEEEGIKREAKAKVRFEMKVKLDRLLG